MNSLQNSLKRQIMGKKQLEKLIKDEGIEEELKKFIDDTNERISGFIKITLRKD